MNKNNQYQICTRCVMDTTDPDIIFDKDGVCNHCTTAIKTISEIFTNQAENEKKLKEIIQTVKEEGKYKKYDCIIGLSGGIDSSFLAYVLVKKFGIKPLAIHIDNGWNSELAVKNIENVVTKLNIDLYTHVIDWNEFKDLQRSFLLASVVDLEMLSDHAIVIVANKIAKQKNITYFLIGSNYQTESILPRKWFYPNKLDSLNIKNIHKIYGSVKKLKTFPLLSFIEYIRFGKKYGKYLMPLSYMKYDKDNAKNILKKELDWKDYGAKHHESFITMFYQSYILPNKFNIDKRKAHLSSLICAGQIMREDAIKELKKPIIDENKLKESKEYFCKKMNLSIDAFDDIMKKTRKEHNEFKSYLKIKKKIQTIISFFKTSNN